MGFKIFGKEGSTTLMLIPGLGVSYEIFLPLIDILKDKFHIIAVQIDGFTLDRRTEFTSVKDQAIQVSNYIKEHHDGRLDVAYGLSLGGKILSHVLEHNEVTIDHAILDAAPLLPLPRWLVTPLKYLQCANVWTCYHWTGFWRWVFHSHYFDVLLDECRNLFPYGGTKLESISGNDIHYWHGTKESFVAKPQVKHLKGLFPNTTVEVFKGLNHGQLLIDYPEEVAKRIIHINQK